MDDVGKCPPETKLPAAEKQEKNHEEEQEGRNMKSSFSGSREKSREKNRDEDRTTLPASDEACVGLKESITVEKEVRISSSSSSKRNQGVQEGVRIYQ